MKKKIFFPALSIFLLLIAAVMFVRLPMQRNMFEPLKKAVESGMQNLAINALPFTPDGEGSAASWSKGVVKGAVAWRDNKTGIIWGPQIKDLSFFTLLPKDLAAAKDACRKQNPAGDWSLPLAKEFATAKLNGLAEADKDEQGYWLTYTVNKTMGDIPGSFPLGPIPKQRIFSVRCIGHSAK